MKHFFFVLILSTIVLPAQAATLKPDIIGNVQSRNPNQRSLVALPEWTLSTGSKSKTVASPSLSYWLGIKQPSQFISNFGLQGSAARFKLRSGTYSIVWQFETVETDGDDIFLMWNGKDLQTLATSRIATLRSGTKQVSYWQRSKIQTTGEISFIALDTRDRVGVSSMKIYEIQRTPEPNAIAAMLTPFLFIFRRRLQS